MHFETVMNASDLGSKVKVEGHKWNKICWKLHVEGRHIQYSMCHVQFRVHSVIVFNNIWIWLVSIICAVIDRQ